MIRAVFVLLLNLIKRNENLLFKMVRCPQLCIVFGNSLENRITLNKNYWSSNTVQVYTTFITEI